MTTKVFHHYLEHLALGRLDVSADDLTVVPITTDRSSGMNTSANAYSLPTAEWYSAWSSAVNAATAETSAITTLLVAGHYDLKITDLTFNSASDLTVYGLLFYKSTGTAGTSPLVAVDFFDDPVTFLAGVDYPWLAPTYLIRLAVSG